MRRRRLLAAVVGVILLLAALLAINALIVSAETRPARANIGFIVRLAHGDDLQVREDGPRNAPVIVLLHGFTASLQWWNGVTPTLAAHFRVIRFDLLGHGGSAKPSRGYSMEHQAQLVDEALGRLAVHRALIVGHSMGGHVATALATRDRSLVAGLVLIDSPPTSSSGELPFIARLGFLPLIGQAARTIATDGMVRSALKSGFAPGYEIPHELLGDYWKMTYNSYVDSAKDSEDYIKREPLPRRLAALGLPLLVLYGTRDQLVAPSSERDYTTVPGAQIVPIRGAGHSPMVEKPYRTSRLILAFASRTLGAKPVSFR